MNPILTSLANLCDPKQPWRLIGLAVFMMGLEELLYGLYSLQWIGCGDPLFLVLTGIWLVLGVVLSIGGFMVTFGTAELETVSAPVEQSNIRSKTSSPPSGATSSTA